jgi:hypothetical protein
MLTFREFRESEESKSDEKALDVVRKGLNIQRGKDFWSDFTSLCGNAEGMADLLDVPKEKVTALAGRINNLKSQIEAKETKIKDKLVKTGGDV